MLELDIQFEDFGHFTLVRTTATFPPSAFSVSVSFFHPNFQNRLVW